MNIGLNAHRQELNSNSDMTSYDEVSLFNERHYNTKCLRNHKSTITDGTTMTESTPEVIITGTVANPTIVVGETSSFNGTSVTLGTTGTNLNAIIADINDAAITGLVASKNATNNCPHNTTFLHSWTYIIDVSQTII